MYIIGTSSSNSKSPQIRLWLSRAERFWLQKSPASESTLQIVPVHYFRFTEFPAKINTLVKFLGREIDQSSACILEFDAPVRQFCDLHAKLVYRLASEHSNLDRDFFIELDDTLYYQAHFWQHLVRLFGSEELGHWLKETEKPSDR
jgi:hypothetical protein